MTTHLKVKHIMRNNQWQKHQQVFETIKFTKKLVCPSGHTQDLLLNCENDIYSFNDMCWQANRFLNNMETGDIVLLYDRQYKEALVLKITSNPIKDIVDDVVILRNNGCGVHKPTAYGCADCNNSIIMVFSTKYFEDNAKKFVKYLSEYFCFENMYGIFRNVTIIGKINESCAVYHNHKTMQTSIGTPKYEVLLPISDIISV